MNEGDDANDGANNGADHGGDDPGRGRRLIASVLVIALLLAAGLWLTGAIGRDSAIQDCVAAGRTNCAPVGG